MENLYQIQEVGWEPDELVEEAIKQAKETLESIGLKGRIQEALNSNLPGAMLTYPEPRMRDSMRERGKYFPVVQAYIYDPTDFEDLAKALEKDIQKGDILEKRYFDDGDVRYIDMASISAELVKDVW